MYREARPRNSVEQSNRDTSTVSGEGRRISSQATDVEESESVEVDGEPVRHMQLRNQRDLVCLWLSSSSEPIFLVDFKLSSNLLWYLHQRL